jgi:integrase
MERANLEPAIKLIIVEIYNKLSEAARMPRRQRPVLKTGYLGQIIALQDEVCTERLKQTSPQDIVNMFARWYEQIGFDGCSSHSGRRTFIKNAARKISWLAQGCADAARAYEPARHASMRITMPNGRSSS